jgi:hypothetical protein
MNSQNENSVGVPDIGKILVGYPEGAVTFTFKQNVAQKYFVYEIPPGDRARGFRSNHKFGTLNGVKDSRSRSYAMISPIHSQPPGHVTALLTDPCLDYAFIGMQNGP